MSKKIWLAFINNKGLVSNILETCFLKYKGGVLKKNVDALVYKIISYFIVFVAYIAKMQHMSKTSNHMKNEMSIFFPFTKS